MIAANGENRKLAAQTLLYGVALAVGTKVGEWAIERLRKGLRDPAPEPTPKSGGANA